MDMRVTRFGRLGRIAPGLIAAMVLGAGAVAAEALPRDAVRLADAGNEARMAFNSNCAHCHGPNEVSPEA